MVILMKYIRHCNRRYDQDKDNKDGFHTFDMIIKSSDKKQTNKHSLEYKLTWLQTYYDILLTKHWIIVMIVLLRLLFIDHGL